VGEGAILDIPYLFAAGCAVSRGKQMEERDATPNRANDLNDSFFKPPFGEKLHYQKLSNQRKRRKD